MAQKKTLTTKTTKKAAAKKSTAKKTQAKRSPAKKEDLVVFAIRLTKDERDAIHQAAGPRRATQFVRAVALAAAREDEGAFRQTVKEARAARS